MKITSYKSKDKIAFNISNYHEKYEDIFKMCYYQKKGNNYYKEFSADIKNINKIADYFKNNAQEMFDQLGYFKPIPWQKAFLAFLQIIDGHDIDWWLTGSCACCIRGIPLNPHDVDIMINSKDADKISELFSDYIIEPIINTGGWLTKDFGVIFLHARIDIASDPVEALDYPLPIDCGPYAKKYLQELEWQGFKIRVPPLQLHINANEKRGRSERVSILKKYL